MRRTAREGKDRPEQAKSPNWQEFVRLAHQAVVAIAGTGIINGAEPRACGLRRVSVGPDTEPGQERNTGAASNEAGNGFGRAPHPRAWASNRTGENSPSGMIRGGGGNGGRT